MRFFQNVNSYFAFFSEFEKDVIAMELRQRIKMLCEQENISMNQLEKDCGFGKGYISKIGKTSTPTSKKLQQIADYFGVTMDYLTNGKKTEFDEYSHENAELVAKIRNDTELSKALQKYFELSDAKKKHVVELINLLSEV